ncbi:mpv17-like protein isoform X2 [Nilaparvata lugens]|uniref:mpv17-like protein isoform X2 n=1 Tax=Nilaparvata lugens TaxID=108931 RepID=UPI000B98102F|nr:mpv17-like protein isoform X2 [Nilaparvata lugens]XP_039285022.1 mpv17-like protein isoform X2 [Nilaparvata lugens]XP_039285023.1 mpv17-like protein isoform X2 [Nilaparvata lugens]XP_039285024.1 mpv17-like protein isoform X2 [Nilaparvata lugens]XP_039285025.1 mpv17-like protein isoform X2 [Nilaparvata lugens]XP_039285026.1 mpv17-like protein isoform X2 [Nilaparvata lugens]XP_039285027.1 mpv17-like protein isoform X2 [Nilaparvata lugens]XP_039285028.1 mpv17-like protein isoform X2 [Nilapar
MASFIKSAFTRYPVISNAVVYGTMCVGAEFTQQTFKRNYSEKSNPPPYDVASLGRYAVVGTCINSNLLYFWFTHVENLSPGTSLRSIFHKTILTQVILSPIFVTSFYISMSIMEGKQDIFEECKQKFIPTFKSSCGFWLPAQTINFLLVPPAARVVYVGTCSFLWLNILCLLKSEKVAEDTPALEAL